MHSRVFLIAQPTVRREDGSTPKLEPLARYGEVVVLIPAGDRPAFQPFRTLELLRRKLADFNTETDYIAWAGGDTLGAVLAGTVLADLGMSNFRWLRYDRAKDASGRRVDEGAQYLPVEIDLGDLDDLEGNQLEMFDEPDFRGHKAL